MKISKEDFYEFQTRGNYVLIEPSRGNDEIILPSGLKLYIDITFEKEKHAVTTGTIIKTPKYLVFNRKRAAVSVEFDVDMTLLPGDKVFFHYLVSENCIKDGRYYEVDGRIYFMVKYDRIFCAKRGDEVVMVNGWVLVEPVEEDVYKTNLILPEYLKKQVSQKEGIVKYVGPAVRSYFFEPEIVENDKDAKPGDRILFSPNSDIPLEYDLHASFEGKKKYFRMQRKDIFGVLETIA